MPKTPSALQVVQPVSPELAILERCRADLAQMQDLSSVLELRDRAVAIRSYMKAKDDARESQNSAACIAALAEARAGQLIAEGQKEGSIRTQGAPVGNVNGLKDKTKIPTGKDCPPKGPATLEEIGVGTHQSHRFKLAAEVAEKDPEWFDKYRDECSKTGKDFTQQAVIRRGKELKNKDIAAVKPSAPQGLYDVIVMDPPWPMKQIETEMRPQASNVGFDYPTMTEDEMEGLTVPSADDCHLFVWTTQRFLPMAMRLVPVWGFQYSCLFVWHKTKGMQPLYMPYYNCEFVVYARKGNPKFKTTKDFKTCNQWPHNGHSVKPEEFYAMLRRVTGGKRLDMFSRRKIEGFTTWGSEAPNENAAR